MKTVLAHTFTAMLTLTACCGHFSRSHHARTALARSDHQAKAGDHLTSSSGFHHADSGIPDANYARSPSPPSPEDVLKKLDPDERNNVKVYAAANKSVVNITTEAEGLGFFGDETSTGTGSGFVIDKQGRLLTNFHVIQGANSVRVTLFDGSQHDARVVGADASTDVAVLVIDVPAEKLFPLTLGDSSTCWSVRRFWPWAILSVWSEP